MLNLKSIHHSKYNILLVAENNELFIIGDNYCNKSGINTNGLHISKPMPLGIKLDSGESIKSFITHVAVVFIYTDQKRLIIPHNNADGTRDRLMMPEVKEYFRVDVDPERRWDPKPNRNPTNLLKMDFNYNSFNTSENLHDKSTSIQDKSRSIQDKSAPIKTQSELEPSVQAINAWTALSHEAFGKLPRKKQRKYLKCAVIRLQCDMIHGKSWCNSDYVVKIVLEQIHNNIDSKPKPHPEMIGVALPRLPVVVKGANLSTLNEGLMKEPTLVVSGYYQPKLPRIKKQHKYSGIRRFNGTNPVIMTDIDNVVFGISANIYLIGDKIVAEVFNTLDTRWQTLYLPFKRFGDQTNCYEIIHSFSNHQKIVTRDFLVIKETNDALLYHLIVPHASNTNPVLWIRFRSDFEIDFTNVYWNYADMNIYVIRNKIIYCYDWTSERLTKLIDSSTIKTFIVDTGFYFESVFINNQGMHVRSELECLAGVKLANYSASSIGTNPYFEIIKDVRVSVDYDFAYYYVLYEQVVENPFSSRLNVLQTVPYIDITGVKYYGVLHWGCFAYILCGRLNIFTRKRLNLYMRNCSSDVYHYEQSVPFLETEIVNVIINGFILIETKDAFIYTCANLGFKFKMFGKHTISLPRNFPLNLIDYTSQLQLCEYSDCSESYHIEVTGAAFDQFINVIPKNKVKIYRFRATHKGMYAIGTGSRYMAIEAVLKDFANRFLVKHNFMTSLNLKALGNRDDKYLNLIGKALAMAFVNLGNRLSIRLPLLIQAAIFRCSLTQAEWEFFAYREDADAFEILHSIRYNDEELRLAGFESYLQGLQSICKFNTYASEKEINHAYDCARKIADGFLNQITIKNTLNINLPTFDWCLSGEYEINIPEFLTRQVSYSHFSDAQMKMFVEYVKNLSLENFSKLLLNWSGASFPRDGTYQVILEQHGRRAMQFGTCSRTMYIHQSIFDNYDSDLWNIIFLDQCLYLDG